MPRGQKTTAAKKAEILELLKLGTLSIAEIAAQCGVCKAVVQSVEFCNGGVLKTLHQRLKTRSEVWRILHRKAS